MKMRPGERQCKVVPNGSKRFKMQSKDWRFCNCQQCRKKLVPMKLSEIIKKCGVHMVPYNKVDCGERGATYIYIGEIAQRLSYNKIGVVSWITAEAPRTVILLDLDAWKRRSQRRRVGKNNKEKEIVNLGR
eukprot:CAMPEP_0206390176 /NCGR_PEP_ID=MMETSP0294-20121207/18439_1 /ASSEMBLY_ACC=CAM_ASM_000327 /TAXON_ID=39354 /ORGANISM="Heterosigma akashiwo, Strain CCMP2393" /LENGTH=130 /DNA_ID=CAMNT_0053842477 /DNA_START=442 /DNA_END=830 /DNA_ORIENTATION=+